MFFQALYITLYCILDIFQSFLVCITLGYTTRQGWTLCDEDPVFISLNYHPIFHTNYYIKNAYKKSSKKPQPYTQAGVVDSLVDTNALPADRLHYLRFQIEFLQESPPLLLHLRHPDVIFVQPALLLKEPSGLKYLSGDFF